MDAGSQDADPPNSAGDDSTEDTDSTSPEPTEIEPPPIDDSVTPTSAPPVASSQEVIAEKDTPITVTLSVTGGQAPIEFTVVSGPAHGTLATLLNTGPSAGTVAYTPAASFTGYDSLTFEVRDGAQRSTQAEVRLVVLDHAKAPLIGRRVPQWPLKTSSTLYPPTAIAYARGLVSTNSKARWVRDDIVQRAAYWLTKSEQELYDVLPDARVPRSADVSTSGCPIHGAAVYEYGTYPWLLDREHPFQVICPIGGERYPSNDFQAYYHDGLRDFRLLSGPYADSGRGWVSPGGEKFWFAAHACQLNWAKTWYPAVVTLSQAYALTGDRRYARRAIALLDRIAEVYPNMDYSTQSRYGEMYTWKYPGKILNWIGETFTLRDMAAAYDLVFDALIGPDAEDMPWRDAAAIRANIEANLLEEGLDAIQRGDLAGNFGRNQSALANTVVVRQNGPTEALIESIFATTGGIVANEGMDYALYNFVSKDGFPDDTSPFYQAVWIDAFTEFAVPLALTERNLFAHPRIARIYNAPLRLLCAQGFTPATSNAGSIFDGWIAPERDSFEAAYRAYGGPRLAWAVKHQGGSAGPNTYWRFCDLFAPLMYAQVDADAAADHPVQASRILDGYGMAILNDPADTTAVSMFYGPRGLYGHADSMNIELFGQGQRLSPDLGYPDHLNGLVSGIYSWTQNTVSHNCVVVDDAKQDGLGSGDVLRFTDSPSVRFVDAESAQAAYASTDVYRRQLLQVDVAPGAAYLVDVFRVRGGSRHVLSIHGPPGAFAFSGASLTNPVTVGTLAGSDVPYGALYDDPIRGEPGYSGLYLDYAGSGYQHLFNWQQTAPTSTVAGTWVTGTTPPAQLRVHIPAWPGQDVIVADAYVSPLRRIPTILKYMLVRRDADASGNTFVTVWETSSQPSTITDVRLWNPIASGVGSEQVVGLTITRGDVVDTLAVAPGAGATYSFTSTLPSTGTWTANAAAFLVSEQTGNVLRKFAVGGSTVQCTRSGRNLSVPATVAGTVAWVDYLNQRMAMNVAVDYATAADLVNRTVRIHNARHSCVYTITAAQSTGAQLILALGGSELITGRIRIDSVDNATQTVKTPTLLYYEFHMGGMTLAKEDFSYTVPIEQVANKVFKLTGPAAPFVPGQDAWIVDFGVGDQVEIERSSWQ